MVRRFWVGGVDGRATLRLCHLLEAAVIWEVCHMPTKKPTLLG